MIFNDTQYNVTLSQLQLLWDGMEDIHRKREAIGLIWAEELELAGLKSIYDELMSDITDYMVDTHKWEAGEEMLPPQISGGFQMLKIGDLWINLEGGWNTIHIVSADTVQVHTQLGISSVTGTVAEVEALEAMLARHADLHAAHIELLTLQKKSELTSFSDRQSRIASRMERMERTEERAKTPDRTGETDE